MMVTVTDSKSTDTKFCNETGFNFLLVLYHDLFGIKGVEASFNEHEIYYIRNNRQIPDLYLSISILNLNF